MLEGLRTWLRSSLQCQYQIIGSLSSAVGDTSLCDFELSFGYRRLQDKFGLHFQLQLSKKENFLDCWHWNEDSTIRQNWYLLTVDSYWQSVATDSRQLLTQRPSDISQE